MADKKKHRGRSVFVGLVLGIALCVGGVYAYEAYLKPMLEGYFAPPVAIVPETAISLDVLQESIHRNNELSTAKYLYTNAEGIEDQNNLAILGHKEIRLPFTKAVYVIEFDGVIKAGYNLDDATVELADDNVVVVTLPPAQVLSHETSDVRVTYEQQNMMNPLHIGEESTWIASQMKIMEQRAIDLGLFDEAQQNAKVTFESLFAPAIPEGTTLKVVFLDEKGQVQREQ